MLNSDIAHDVTQPLYLLINNNNNDIISNYVNIFCIIDFVQMYIGMNTVACI